MATKKKSNIDDFKNRFESPVVGVRIDPKTGKPLKKKAGAKKRTR